MTLVTSDKDFERRRNHFAHLDHDSLVQAYEKAKKEGKTMKVAAIAKILFDKFGEGDQRSGADWGNEISNNEH